MTLESKIKKVQYGDPAREVTVVTVALTKEEAREMFPYRPDSKYAESRFGGNNMTDDIALLLGKNAKRCGMCQAPTRKEYLDPYCPDCDGSSEYNGTSPRALVN